MEEKKTVVFGASENVERYANKAIRSLRKHGHPVVAIGLREGKVLDVDIIKENPPIANVDTVTLYMSEKNQKNLQDYILSLNPKRIIYNPGAENPELEALAEKKGIENMEASTLVLLATNQF
jgi:predicted CoA-binding protein